MRVFALFMLQSMSYTSTQTGKSIARFTKEPDPFKETLVSMITTRGSNMNSFCYEMDQYAIKVLEGITTAEDFFVDIFCLDDGDDPWDEQKLAQSCTFYVRLTPNDCKPCGKCQSRAR